MSIAEENGAFDAVQEEPVQEWGDFEGRTGSALEGNWYEEAFEDVEKILQDGPEYMRFGNVELPKEQVLEKYGEELEPGEDEFLKASLESYDTRDGQFKVLSVEKGEIESYRVASEGRSHRPAVTTDELPGEGARLASINEGPSDTYRIMWEE